NDFREPLDKIVRETSTYYVIGYRPAKPFDGSYRKLDVRITRPDAFVRARKGYVASRAPAAPVPEPATAPAGAPPGAPPTTTAPLLTLASGKSGIGVSMTDEAGLLVRPNSVNLVSELSKAKVGAGTTPAGDADGLAHEGWQLYAKGKAEEAREKLAAAAAS